MPNAQRPTPNAQCPMQCIVCLPAAQREQREHEAEPAEDGVARAQLGTDGAADRAHLEQMLEPLERRPALCVLEEVPEGGRRLDVLEVDGEPLAALARAVGGGGGERAAERLRADQQPHRAAPAVGDGCDEADAADSHPDEQQRGNSEKPLRPPPLGHGAQGEGEGGEAECCGHEACAHLHPHEAHVHVVDGLGRARVRFRVREWPAYDAGYQAFEAR